jgi:hypothetical protein
MRKTRLLSVTFLMLGIFAGAASAQKDRFVGTFVAEEPNTSGITRLALYNDDTINVWGKCSPTDCDWGEETAVAYAPTAGSELRSTAKVLSAIYVKHFATKVLVIRPLKDDKLRVDIFTRFTDRSGRTAYAASYVMVREATAQ